MKPVKKLFLIDDDEIFVYLTRKTIESTNKIDEIKVFNDGQEAVKFLKKNSTNTEELPDIIFLDLNMPVMDGWEFLEEYIILEPKFKKRVILYLVSSTISPYDIERANSIGVVTDLLIKPLEKDRIIELLKNFNND